MTTTYSDRMAEFAARERRASAAAATVENVNARVRELGTAVLLGNMTEQEALDELARFEQEERRARLYHAAIRPAVEQIRAERDAYVRSDAGKADKRQHDVDLRENRHPTQADLAEQRALAIRAKHAAKKTQEEAARKRYEQEVAAERLRLYAESPEGVAERERLRLMTGRV
jgi:hypothetical protein